MKHYINRKTVENNELLPSAAYLQDWITHEVDTGNVFMSNGTVITKVQGADKTETLKNKQLELLDNNFTNTNGIIDNSFLSDMEIKGGVVPATTISDSFYGILEDNAVLQNPNKPVTNALNQNFDSVVLEFRTGDPDGVMGFVSQYPYFSREMGFEVKSIIKSVSRKLYYGFSTSNVLDLDSACVFIGFDQDSTHFTIYSSNGLNNRTEEFTIPKDVFEHTVEVILRTDSIICKLDDEEITLTTIRIPAITDQLYLHCYGIV